MKEVTRIDLFNKNCELFRNIETILKTKGNFDDNRTSVNLFYSRIYNNLIGEENDNAKEYEALDKVVKYLKREIDLGNTSLFTMDRVLQEVEVIKENIYGGKNRLYEVATNFVLGEINNLNVYDIKDLAKLDKVISSDLSEKLGILFGANRGNIVGEFNKGMYDMTQSQMHDVFAKENVVYRNDRFIDIMSEQLLRYRLAGLRLINHNVDLIFNNYGLEPAKLKRNLNFDDLQKDYDELKMYSNIIGLSVKNLYSASSGLTPLEQLKVNGYQEQMTFDDASRERNSR